MSDLNNETTTSTDASQDSSSIRPVPTGNADQQAHAKAFAIDAARLINDLHGEGILLLDVRGISQITDFLLIASGTSDRQIGSVGDDVEKLAKERGLSRFGRETDDRTMWVVLDFVDVMVHLFEPATRAHYDLEMMWGDAPRITWRRS